jgi:hypothetical protein
VALEAPIARADHDKALRDTTEAIHRQYEWAKDFPDELKAPEYRQQYAQWMNVVNTSPVDAIRSIMEQGLKHPQHAEAIRSFWRGLTTTPEPAPTPPARAVEPPGPDLKAPDGTLLYSADQLAKREQWFQDRLEGKFADTLKPLHATLHQWQQAADAERERAATAQRYQQIATETTAALAKLPLFKEHEAEIAAALHQMPVTADNAAALARDAYLSVVLPKLSAQQQTQALADHARRADATTARPNASRATTPNVAPSFAEELAATWHQHKQRTG